MKPKDLAQLLSLAAVWGASFLFLRIAAPAVGSLAVSAFRVSLAALILLPLVALRGELGLLKRHRAALLGTALLSAVLPFLGLSQASRSLPAGLLSILNATTPMWGALVGWLWAREKLTALRALGLTLGFGGVALLAADSSSLNVQGAHGAAALALGSTLMYALAVHFNKRFLPHMSPVTLSTGTLVMSSMVLLPPALWLGPQPLHADASLAPDWAGVPRAAWLALLALAVMCTAAAYLVFYRLIDRIGASRALTVTFLIPVFGMLWGALFLGEQVTSLMLISTGVVLLGTWLSNHGHNTPATVSKEAPP
jgi:drug/metabolite transporter (DMT)-like permease